MILAQNLNKSFGERLILSDVSFRIDDKEKVGIVGKNGAGKSTLLKLIVGSLEPDGGSISGTRQEDFGYAEQIPTFSARTLLDELLISDGAQEFQAKKILYGLGFNDDDLIKNPNEFSGGESAKIALGKALIVEPRILILDEPTNHLDIYSIDFLENFVKNYNGTVIAVTHDRHFLQHCVDKIIDIDHHRATVYVGNYEKFARLKSERLEHQLKEYEKQQEAIAREEEYIRRNKAGVNAKQARGRQKKLDRLERIEKPPAQETPTINLLDASDTANKVLIIEGLNFKNIIRDFSIEILKGEKVGLIGKNGVGKSTLLKLIVGELKADDGTIKIGNRVKVGFLSQGHEDLDQDSTPIDELINTFGLTIERARSELARLELYADLVTKPIGSLSGGEKTRVALAKLILTGANFLLLDEPTNHLDLPAREAIENALLNFEGTVLIVTHDRYLLDKVTDRVIELEPAVKNKLPPVKKSAGTSPTLDEFTPPKSKKISKPLSQEAVERLEAQIAMAEMELKLIEHEINSEVDPQTLSRLAVDHNAKLDEIDQLYKRWEESV
ncbi:MAG: ABC-F family ATP-binding cassette domain-containing protein [Selenomonadaceae bacterium]|nr:ABC-F family ATP-binding cassette domain-containing protein [Selenomonadaceae bacterium]